MRSAPNRTVPIRETVRRRKKTEHHMSINFSLQTNKTMNNKNEVFKIIITAVVTSVLTLLSSWFILFKQQNNEQKYWLMRSRNERLQKLSDQQIKLFEETNNDILTAELMSKDLKLSTIEFTAKLYGSKSIRESKELISGNQLKEKAIAYNKLTNKLGSDFQMCAIYFGSAVNKPIKEVSEAIAKNYNNNSILGEPVEKQSLSSVLNYFTKDMGTIELLEKNRICLLDSMQRQIAIVVRTMNTPE